MSNFFDENPSDLDMLEEAQDLTNYEYTEDESESVWDSSSESAEELIEEVMETKPSYSFSKQEKSVVTEAMLRLEQARLYEMLLKHNFFDGVRVNLAARQNVEQELKKFILDRLEILLGIKQEAQQINSSEVTVDLPFNDVEIEFLKALAYKGTNGASISASPAQAQATIQPMNQKLPKIKQPEGLKPLSQSKPKPQLKAQPKPIQQAPKQQIRQPIAQVKTQSEQKVSQAPSNKKNKTVEDIAREDIERMKNRKPAHEMTVKELVAANKRIDGGGSRPRPKNALPPPTAEQQMAAAMMTNKAYSSGSANFNEMISRALGAVPVQTIADD
jgi:hypothetical protein